MKFLILVVLALVAVALATPINQGRRRKKKNGKPFLTKDGKVKYGDLRLTKRQYVRDFGDATKTASGKRRAMSPRAMKMMNAPDNIWNKHIVNGRFRIAWKIGEKTFKKSQLAQLKTAMKVVEKHYFARTALEFNQWGQGDGWKHTHWIEFKDMQSAGEGGCWSDLGRVTSKGGQTISLSEGCVYADTIVHEIMHALGWHHEQTRTDRDDWVTIMWNNMAAGAKFQFQKVEAGAFGSHTFGSKYDFKSIMHYGKNDFSKNGKPVIVPKNPKNKIQTDPNGLTALDAFEINSMYTLHESCKAKGQQWAFSSADGKVKLAATTSSANTCSGEETKPDPTEKPKPTEKPTQKPTEKDATTKKDSTTQTKAVDEEEDWDVTFAPTEGTTSPASEATTEEISVEDGDYDDDGSGDDDYDFEENHDHDDWEDEFDDEDMEEFDDEFDNMYGDEFDDLEYDYEMPDEFPDEDPDWDSSIDDEDFDDDDISMPDMDNEDPDFPVPDGDDFECNPPECIPDGGDWGDDGW